MALTGAFWPKPCGAIITAVKTNIKITFLASATLLAAEAAHGALVINFAQVGPDVVITASGSLNVSGLTLYGSFMGPSSASQVFSAVSDQSFFRSVHIGDQNYELPVFHVLFSNSFSLINSVSAGDSFGIYTDDLYGYTDIYVPGGFTSGTINGTMTLANTDLSTLGVNPLAPISWGSGAADQSLSITVGASPIPEPSTYLAIIGFTGIGLLLWRRRMTATASKC